MSAEVMSHSRVVRAAPDVVYDLVADVTRWPVIFEPSVLVRHLHRGPDEERFRLWATVGGAVRNWTSRRVLDAGQRRIAFEQERSQAPIASMGGGWSFRELGPGTTKVVLDHHFTVVDGADAAQVAAAVDRNSVSELAALARIAELGHPAREVVHTFEDTVTLDCSASEAYDFVYHSERWPEQVPHVGRVELTEDADGVQLMEMDTVTAGGLPHTTKSIRVCVAGERIDYKQLVPPAILFGHSGGWEFADGPGGAVVTARHTVAIDPAAAREILGANTDLADARAYLTEALSSNSRNTLRCAERHAASTKSPT
ncbi:aromatase/cyclase [Nocardia implantans]|uniref:Aromatase/cyclase n=1 Tax=Nocardia implantans TaxID=3108168 RepID=A0ABU6B2Z9_9NOCA|nr:MULTISPECIES: aromatase/cyclase [unclassified Nocardia]MBF6194756.1 aromatase/cyclase [Nocardia beijingensis]MEA3530586.1 aromatase/cyclase [Nocardia sp. CDC192]MEB3514140.1 aromatase/cyclase [Nocardia sp. CDC186]